MRRPFDSTFHTPVMLDEVMQGLHVREGGTYIDATLGGGGHAWEIVRRGGRLLGIDQDPEALAFTKQRMEDGTLRKDSGQGLKMEKKGSWKLVYGNFRDIKKIARENGFDQANGILFDLGVSSHQIDVPERGFSFRYATAPLDLRMDQRHGIPASEYIRKLSKEELYEIFATYGEEKLARTIAVALVRARHMRPLTTVGDVVCVIEGVISDPRATMSTCARVFQALRIIVNDELAALKTAFGEAASLLAPGGRLAVLSYHSLEDRIVKREIGRLRLQPVYKKPMISSDEEIRRNPRSRSAKLRIAEKV